MTRGLGAGGVAILAILCCVGLPLVLAAGISAAAAGWIGGTTAGLAVVVAALALIALRRRRRAADLDG